MKIQQMEAKMYGVFSSGKTGICISLNRRYESCVTNKYFQYCREWSALSYTLL